MSGAEGTEYRREIRDACCQYRKGQSIEQFKRGRHQTLGTGILSRSMKINRSFKLSIASFGRHAARSDSAAFEPSACGLPVISAKCRSTSRKLGRPRYPSPSDACPDPFSTKTIDLPANLTEVQFGGRACVRCGDEHSDKRPAGTGANRPRSSSRASTSIHAPDVLASYDSWDCEHVWQSGGARQII